MIVLVDVYFSDHKDKVPIEIQFRTIAMNFWASTEHQLRYKKSRIFTEEMQQELKKCADVRLTLMTRCRIWQMFRGLCSRLSKRE